MSNKLDYDKINTQIEKINKENDLLYLKTLSKKNYNNIIKITENTIKKTNSIIKGSRSLYHTLNKSLFTLEEYNYKDYDLYCSVNEEQNFIRILKDSLEKMNLDNIIKVEPNPVYSNIVIISFYNQKFIDLQLLDKNKMNIIPKMKINNIYYLSPEFMKLDIYNVISTPILFNFLSVDKFLKRISHIEKEFKYKQHNKTLYSLDNNLKIINNLLNFETKCIITGLLAYKILYNNKINVPFLEIFSSNPTKEMEHIKSKIKIDKIDTGFGLDYSIEHFNILYHNNKPLVYIYKLVDCKSYLNRNDKLISTNSGLLYYFNNCIYINKYYNELQNIQIYNIKDIVYTTLLATLYKKFNKNIITRCIGDMQPVIVRSKNILNMNKKIITTTTNL